MVEPSLVRLVRRSFSLVIIGSARIHFIALGKYLLLSPYPFDVQSAVAY